jgi:hypothetical protein
MNERIKLLAEQAGIAVWGDAVYMYHPKDTLDSTVLAKFTELIVRECVTLADKESERYSNLDQEYCSMAMDNYRELVRKHFGVEE